MTISTEIAIKRSVEHSTAIQTINILHRVNGNSGKVLFLLNLQQNLHMLYLRYAEVCLTQIDGKKIKQSLC